MTEYLPAPDPATAPDHPQFNAFVQTIAALRTPEGGCPWDLKQTHASVSQNMLEEAFEAVQCIEEDDLEHLREELGDVLLQVVLQAQIAADEGAFTIDDVCHDVNEKIVRRHPHVFGPEASLAAAGLPVPESMTPDEVLGLWDQIKAHERAQKAAARAERLAAAGLDPAAPEGLLSGVSKGQPALMQAQEVSHKAVGCGFEWESTDAVWAQVESEIAEFKAAPPRSREAELEFGDILFSLVNVARREHLDAEVCLRAACDKFRTRWEHMEADAWREGRAIDSYSTEELEALWQAAKAAEA